MQTVGKARCHSIFWLPSWLRSNPGQAWNVWASRSAQTKRVY